jgi:cell division control protein 24
MTNVTDVVSLSKPGAYTVQIFWKGDPGVESFVIKFTNEEMMKKWAQGLDLQRKENAPQSTVSPDQAAPEFIWNKSLGQMENPYAQQEDEDEEDHGPTPTMSQYGMPSTSQSLAGAIQRNGSSTSLNRQRSMTGDSQQSLAGIARAPPPRFPLPQPPAPLSLQTGMSQGQNSPTPRGGDSYFSPVAESPTSSRTSTTSMFPNSAGYPFPKAGTPQPGGWGSGEDQNRYTAPAIPRAPSRDGPSPVNAYGMVGLNGRNPRGPSLPAMASQQAAAQLQQQRSRSYSTPDIAGQPLNARRSNGPQVQVPEVPGIPPHLTHARHDSNIPRSHTSSPRIDNLPIRTDSPSMQRQYGGQMGQFPAQPIYPRTGTPSGMAASITSLPPPGPPPPGMAPLAPMDPSRTVSPPLGTGSSSAFSSSANPDIPLPTQLKVKVNCDSGNYVTLVVAFNITYQSLIDRIDAKLARFTTSSIAKGMLRLRYRDEDGDFVTIEGDDDIQIAISEWREGVRNMYSGGVGEIELFCVGDTS